MAYSSAKDPLSGAGHASAMAHFEALKLADESCARKRTCGECDRYEESPFTEGNGICVVKVDGRVERIEFVECGTRCFTGMFEKAREA